MNSPSNKPKPPKKRFTRKRNQPLDLVPGEPRELTPEENAKLDRKTRKWRKEQGL